MFVISAKVFWIPQVCDSTLPSSCGAKVRYVSLALHIPDSDLEKSSAIWGQMSTKVTSQLQFENGSHQRHFYTGNSDFRNFSNCCPSTVNIMFLSGLLFCLMSKHLSSYLFLKSFAFFFQSILSFLIFHC